MSLILSIFWYKYLIGPLTRHVTKNPPIPRIGVGHFLIILSIVIIALVENKYHGLNQKECLDL
jgi:hypothetical protein